MGRLNFLIIFVVFVLGLFFEKSAGSPKIILPIKNGAFSISEGSNQTFSCFGEEPMKWSFPSRNYKCYNNETGPLDIKLRLTNEIVTTNGQHQFISHLTLINASFLDTGDVECAYSGDDSSSKDSFYLFVNSPEHALMPCLPPQDACKLPVMAPRQSVRLFLTNYGEYVPCKPTGFEHKVKVQTGGKDLLVHQDPFKGFQILNSSLSRLTVQCFIDSQESGEKCQLDVSYASVDPMCSLSLTTSAELADSRLVLRHSNVTLQCEALCAWPPTGYAMQIEPSRGFYMNNFPYEKVEREDVYRVRSHLTLLDVSMESSGVYSCSFSLPNYPPQTATYTLSVQELIAPVWMVANPRMELIVNPSEMNDTHSLVLSCKAAGIPPPSYKWFNGSEELPDKHQDFDSLVLPPGIGALGNFTCLVSNTVGSINRTYYVVMAQEDAEKLPSQEASMAAWIIGIIMAGVFGVILTILSIGLFGYYRFRKTSRSNRLQDVWRQYFGDGSDFLNFEDLAQSPDPSHESSRNSAWLSDHADLLPYNANIFEINIDQLSFKQILGQGAFGVVFKAEFVASHQLVAVKSIKDSFDIEQYTALCSEIKLLSALGRHLNVCNLVGAVTQTLQRGLLCMVLEYCDGGNLRQFLIENRDRFVDSNDFDYFTLSENHTSGPADYEVPSAQRQLQNNSAAVRSNRPFSRRDLTIFGYQVANGMQFLHSRHCLHRDLAARNILITGEDNVLKISDFGLAKDVYRNGGEYRKKRGGKVPFKWLAPECMRFKVFNKETDIWAFGVLLWEIFTLGKDPYPEVASFDSTFLELLEQDFRLPLPDYADKDICDLVMACWHTLGKERPQFAQITQLLAAKLPQSVLEHYELLARGIAETRQQDSGVGSNFQALEAIQETAEPVASTAIYFRNDGSDEILFGVENAIQA